MSDTLPFTGERFVPGAPGEIWYEHWHRYHFAASMVAGREVLDVACGEGYGSALLARGAACVVGVDLSQAAVDHARARYATIANLSFRQADCGALPFPDASFDLVVSFETIEHISAQGVFLDEIRRLLRPDGVMVLSCPNKVEYSDKRGVVNEFHVRELYRDELAAMLASRFPYADWYGQRAGFYSVVWPEVDARRGEIFEIGETSADAPTSGHTRPLYFLVIASASAAALAGAVPTLSVLADRDEWIYRDYEKVTKSLDAAYRRANALAQKIEEMQRSDEETAREREVSSAATAALAQSAADLASARMEIARRASLGWCLTLPLRRLWRALTGRPPLV